MSAQASETPVRTERPARGRASEPGTYQTGELSTELGKTAVADTVVAKVAGIATRELPGVYAMGAGMARAFGVVRDRLPGGTTTSITQGVTVEVGERQAAIDLDLVVEYGISIPDLADGVRRNVINAVERMCGLEVTEVNITVGDVHLPTDDTPDPSAEPRVQ
ncbi:MAG TPA: Asp23/Gls24 family envelope stress response protein [Streptosporangiaceae bacterium]|jgi:uncharacterized alkaline shock family protein YloU|nr:Asp23/Gls24 family envelope stress response protein [Streptosporangiaceae bacterium]